MTGWLTGFHWRRALTIAGGVALAAWFAYWSWQTIRFYFESFPYHLDMFGFDSASICTGREPGLPVAIPGPHPLPAFMDTRSLGRSVLLHRSPANRPGVRSVRLAARRPVHSRLAGSHHWIGALHPSTTASAGLVAHVSAAGPGGLRGNPHVVCLALILSGASVWRRSLLR